jgi:hypothetical protein
VLQGRGDYGEEEVTDMQLLFAVQGDNIVTTQQETTAVTSGFIGGDIAVGSIEFVEITR